MGQLGDVLKPFGIAETTIMDWLPLYLVIASSDLLDCDNFSDLSEFQ